jgi:hypothetical protein
VRRTRITTSGLPANPIARAVGHYDKGVENFGRNHLIENDPEKQARLAKKYSLAMKILNGPGPLG